MEVLLGLLAWGAINVVAYGIMKHGWYLSTYTPKTVEGREAVRHVMHMIAALVFVMDAMFLVLLALGLAGFMK